MAPPSARRSGGHRRSLLPRFATVAVVARRPIWRRVAGAQRCGALVELNLSCGSGAVPSASRRVCRRRSFLRVCGLHTTRRRVAPTQRRRALVALVPRMTADRPSGEQKVVGKTARGDETRVPGWHDPNSLVGVQFLMATP